MRRTGKAGQNRWAEFRQVAERMTSEMRAMDGVCGIILLGGLARGFADDDSDIDITVFVDGVDPVLRRRLRKIAADWQLKSGFEVDFEVHDMEEFARREWTEIDRWELGKAEIVFDPTGSIKRLFEEGLKVPDGFWTDRIVKCCTYLRWYSFPCPGQKCIAETWLDRGDHASAHCSLNYSIDLVIELVFALNREFLPPPKWKLQYARDLKWLPRDFEECVTGMTVIKSLSRNELYRRLEAGRKMWPELLEKVERETGLDTDAIARHYVEKILGQK